MEEPKPRPLVDDGSKWLSKGSPEPKKCKEAETGKSESYFLSSIKKMGRKEVCEQRRERQVFLDDHFKKQALKEEEGVGWA
jgi:hypothetical protein